MILKHLRNQQLINNIIKSTRILTNLNKGLRSKINNLEKTNNLDNSDFNLSTKNLSDNKSTKDLNLLDNKSTKDNNQVNQLKSKDNNQINQLKSEDQLNELKSEIDDETTKLSTNLTSYLKMIKQHKTEYNNTYIFIFTDRKSSIKLPENLNSTKYEYFTNRNKEMCLIDLNCDKQIIDSIFQNYSEDKLGDLKFYHVKGPFISSNLIIDHSNHNDIQFQNLIKQNINYLNLKKFNTPTNQLEWLLEQNQISELEKRIKFTLINYLERNICKGVFENFELLPFGSSFTGLGICNGDLDLLLLPKPINKNHNSKELNEFILKNNLTYLYKQAQLNKRLVNQCLSIIKGSLNLLPGFSIGMHIQNANVPIIKLSCPIVNVEMDISMSLKTQNNGVILMSQTLYSYCKLFPNLRKLSTILRLWGTENQIIKPQPSDSLKNFTLLMLLISFLQTRKSTPLLPSMHQILTCPNLDELDIYLKANENINLFELIAEFFEFIIKFDFVRHAIDVYEGKFVRNLSQDPIYIKNPYDIEILNMARNMNRSSVINLKQLTKKSLSNYNPNDLSSLFGLRIQLPEF